MVEPRAFVLLKSRRQLDLLNPDPNAWTDEDLAAGLSRTMRWSGVSRWEHPLSVAQHSLTVLAICEAERLLTPIRRAEESRAENMEQKLENLGELIDIAGGFHSAREFLDHAGAGDEPRKGRR
jgi:5'-nucleotidase